MSSKVDGVKKSTKKNKKKKTPAQEVQEEEDDDMEPIVPPPAAFVGDQFGEWPLLEETLQGLEEGGFTTATRVQQLTIPRALQGSDIFGAAKTGSGKTLAFVIPVLEVMTREGWNTWEGLGALILTPTRELAQQIFRVLTIVGRYHQLSCGLVAGGMKLNEESKRIYRMGIIVATPGRLLMHLDQTENFTVTNLKMLVLDEADRLIDPSFAREVDAIMEHLPPTERQTMCFSATQTLDVKVAARLGMENPEYISAHAMATKSTPTQLTHLYMVVPLEEKLNVLYSFIRAHKDKKIVCFFATCNQARFVFAGLSKLFAKYRVALALLNGRMKQSRRTEVFHAFSAKGAAALLCTDVAARGLDFPTVDWVISVDCPEDEKQYIHRAGRTARNGRSGSSLLMLLESEQMMIPMLRRKQIDLHEVEVTRQFKTSIRTPLQALVVQDPDLKHKANKAVGSYLRAVYFMANPVVFKYDAVKPSAENFALSMGLAQCPTVPLVGTKKAKNADRTIVNARAAVTGKQKTQFDTRLDRNRAANHMYHLTTEREKFIPADGAEEEDDEPFLVKATKPRDIDEVTPDERNRGLSNRKRKRIQSGDLNVFIGTRTVFDDTGATEVTVTPDDPALLQEDKALVDAEQRAVEHVGALRHKVLEADVIDVPRDRQRVKAKHLREKVKARGAVPPPISQSAAVAMLGSPGASDHDDNDDNDDNDSLVDQDDEGSATTDSEAPQAKRRKVDGGPSLEEQEELAARILAM